MATTTVGTLITDFVDAIGSTLSANLGTILLVAAALVGLGILIHYVRKWVGRK